LPPSDVQGRHFDQEIIILCMRWYVTYKLSYRDLAAMMLERGVAVAPNTIFRWVKRDVPELERRWDPFSRPIGWSWRVDETYIGPIGTIGFFSIVASPVRTALPLGKRHYGVWRSLGSADAQEQRGLHEARSVS
jgi:hypothetical protein